MRSQIVKSTASDSASSPVSRRSAASRRKQQQQQLRDSPTQSGSNGPTPSPSHLSGRPSSLNNSISSPPMHPRPPLPLAPVNSTNSAASGLTSPLTNQRRRAGSGSSTTSGPSFEGSVSLRSSTVHLSPSAVQQQLFATSAAEASSSLEEPQVNIVANASHSSSRSSGAQQHQGSTAIWIATSSE